MAFIEPTGVRETNPRVGFGERGGVGVAEDGVDEFGFGGADVVFGEFDGFVNGSMGCGAHEV